MRLNSVLMISNYDISEAMTIKLTDIFPELPERPIFIDALCAGRMA